MVGVIRDIADRKEVERLKGEFIATVSHELRTPLTSIRGSLGLIESGVIEDPKLEKQLLEMATRNTDRMINLVNDLLDIEKLQSRNMAFDFEELDLNILVEYCIETNSAYAAENGVTFEITASCKSAKVRDDNNRLSQVLANLLSNAAKFSPEGSNVEVQVAQNEDMFRVSISDRGPGVPDEFQDKLFMRFTQADSSDTRAKRGTGLGLNISKEIVERHGGRIGFESRLGEGSVFYFDLHNAQINKFSERPVKPT